MDSLLNLRSLSLTSQVSNHHDYLSNSIKSIFIPINIISILQQRWIVQMKIRYMSLNLMITRHIYGNLLKKTGNIHTISISCAKLEEISRKAEVDNNIKNICHLV